MGNRKKAQVATSGAMLLRAASASFADAVEPLAYLDGLRSALLAWMENHLTALADRAGDLEGVHDPVGRQLDEIRRRFDQLSSILRGFLLVPRDGLRDSGLAEEIGASLQGLMGLELEAMSMQTRIAHSALLQDYIYGNQFGSPLQACEIVFEVDRLLSERFRLLKARVGAIRAAEYGRTSAFLPEDLLGHLIGLGAANIRTLSAIWQDGPDRIGVLASEELGQSPVRRMTFLVDEFVPRQFGLLKTEVELVISKKLKGRKLDAAELLSMLLAMGEANARLLASMGAPSLIAVPLCARG